MFWFGVVCGWVSLFVISYLQGLGKKKDGKYEN